MAKVEGTPLRRGKKLIRQPVVGIARVSQRILEFHGALVTRSTRARREQAIERAAAEIRREVKAIASMQGMTTPMPYANPVKGTITLRMQDEVRRLDAKLGQLATTINGRRRV